MNSQLDAGIRRAIDEIRQQAHEPLQWHEITVRSTHSTADPPREGRSRSWSLGIGVALVASLCVALVAITFDRTAPSANYSSNSTPGSGDARPITEYSNGDIIVATYLPLGWTTSPVVIQPDQSSQWKFADSANGGTGIVNVVPGTVSGPGGGQEVSIGGVVWNSTSTTPTDRSLLVDVGDATIGVTGAGFDSEQFDEFVAGLRASSPTLDPSSQFDATTDGTVVATYQTDDATDPQLALTVAVVDGDLCWALTSTQRRSGSESATDPYQDPSRGTGVQLDPRIALLTLGGESIPENFREEDAPIVETVVDVSGITTADVEAVRIVFANGGELEVPTTELSGQFDQRFFVVRQRLSGDQFSNSTGPIATIAAVA